MSAPDLNVQARANDIVVTMPATTLRVVYRKPHRGSQLVARLDYFQSAEGSDNASGVSHPRIEGGQQ